METAARSSMDQKALEVECVNITKAFADFIALEGVSIRIKAGTVHALLGENGAGKSTLVKCIMGYYHPDQGGVVVNNHYHNIQSPRDAHALGLGMVYQHFTLIPGMTVMENLVMSRSDIPAVINWQVEQKRLNSFLKKFP